MRKASACELVRNAGANSCSTSSVLMTVRKIVQSPLPNGIGVFLPLLSPWPNVLSHQSATNLAASDVHPKVIQQLLGHTTPALTLQVYTHAHTGQRIEAIDAMDELKQRKPGLAKTASPRYVFYWLFAEPRSPKRQQARVSRLWPAAFISSLAIYSVR